MLDTVGPPLRALLDIGNFEPLLSASMARFRGEAPPEITDFSEQYAAIAKVTPYAGLLHAKTHEFDAQGQPIGLDIARALRDGGYTDPSSIEYEGRRGDCWEHTRLSQRLVEAAFASLAWQAAQR